MRKFTNLIIALLLALGSMAQTPGSFSYQAVIRDALGNVMSNKDVVINISVLQGSENGTEVYTEYWNVKTNAFGLVNLEVGLKDPQNFMAINWMNGPYYFSLSVDDEYLGTTPILSVPFAQLAQHVVDADDADADPTNELQNISISGNKLSISGGSTITLPIDSSKQTLTLTGHQLTINGGNTITLPDSIREAELPAQTGNSGKYLTTDGSSPAWSEISFDDVTNKPNIKDSVISYGFSGDYNDLSNKPTTISAEQAAAIVTYTSSIGAFATKIKADSIALTTLIDGNTTNITTNATDIATNLQAIQDTASQLRADIPDVNDYQLAIVDHDTSSTNEIELPEQVTGDANKLLVADGSGGVSWIAPIFGLINWNESSYTYNGVEGAKFTPSSTTTNVDVVLQPKGRGAILANEPDGTYAGGFNRGSGAVDLQSVRDLAAFVASGSFSVISGGHNNQALDDFSVIGGGANNTASENGATVSGGHNNTASGTSSSIGGGMLNIASGTYAHIGGGYINEASNYYSYVGGGQNNKANQIFSLVVGGYNNMASGQYSAVAGGYKNKADGNKSTVAGGDSNIANAICSTVAGGNNNSANGSYSFAVGLGNHANSFGETVLGYYAVAPAGNTKSIVSTDRLFTIGNGTDDVDRSDAFSILKSGNTMVGGSLTINGNGSDTSVTLPTDRGTDGQVLTTDGSGNTSWQTTFSGSSAIVTKSVNYTATSSDKYIVCAAGITISLPTAAGISGTEYIIKNISSSNVTVKADRSGKIIQDAATHTSSATLGVEAKNNWIKLVSDGVNWLAFSAF